MMMVTAVIVQIRSVSTRGSNSATNPSLTGRRVLTVECAIAADPRPASFENAARWKPMIMTPTTPPPTPSGEKAPLIRAVVTGLPSFELQLDVGWDPGVPEELAGTSPGHLMIGMSAVRAIPYVLASPPGIVRAPVFGALQFR